MNLSLSRPYKGGLVRPPASRRSLGGLAAEEYPGGVGRLYRTSGSTPSPWLLVIVPRTEWDYLSTLSNYATNVGLKLKLVIVVPIGAIRSYSVTLLAYS
jgi:hypothetical protein